MAIVELDLEKLKQKEIHTILDFLWFQFDEFSLKDRKDRFVSKRWHKSGYWDSHWDLPLQFWTKSKTNWNLAKLNYGLKVQTSKDQPVNNFKVKSNENLFIKNENFSVFGHFKK